MYIHGEGSIERMKSNIDWIFRHRVGATAALHRDGAGGVETNLATSLFFFQDAQQILRPRSRYIPVLAPRIRPERDGKLQAEMSLLAPW